MKNLTFRQLRVFSEVARQLSFVRAAEALSLTPPAVSMQIKDLEDNIGLPLFDREGRKVYLTTAGEYFLVYARRLLATLKDADDAMARLKHLDTGVLAIGMVSTAKYFVPQLLADFLKEHPGVDARLEVGSNREQMVSLLQSKEIDIAIMGRPPKELSTRAEPFAAHPSVFVAHPDHPLAKAGHVPVAALAPWPLISREPGSGTRRAMELFLRDHQCEPRVTMQMSSNETIKQAVMANMGVSFLSLHTVGLEVRNGLLAVLDIDQTPVMRTWNVVHLQSKVLSPVAEAFRYFLLERAEQFLLAHDRVLLGALPNEGQAPSPV